jgi:DNA modification methylase
MLEYNKLYNEDCLITLSKMDDNSVDLIIADPPYYKIVKEDWDNIWKDENLILNGAYRGLKKVIEF